MKKGNLSITSENIFPIIKKWLYSDHDIFLRELVSNGCDAITKLKKLSLISEATLPDDFRPRVDVIVSSEAKTLTIIDNGLGMTEEEVEKYINQIAFSGAADFMEKYKDKASEEQIIGHFGLGFYSAFMVSDRVTIDTLSYKKDAKPVHWESEGGIDFEMTDGDKTEVGTKITLYLSDDCHEFANEYRIRTVLEKYCAFMPYEIFLTNADIKEEKKEEDANKSAEKEPAKEEKKPINDTTPLWTKHPNECKDEDYKDFYQKVFHDYKEPVFWIHLNMDYPFNLKGILYFPRIRLGYDSLEGTIKLFNNQVFVADNIKEVIPEYMMLLKGVIDCPDLPLNVSRSALQNDGFVTKIQEYISKKIADKLSGLCKVDREFYEKNWESISPFVKYGCLKDEKFCKKMTDYILFKNLEDKYEVLPEALSVKPIDDEEDAENGKEQTEESKSVEETKAESEKTEETEKAADNTEEKKDKTIYYVTDPVQQSQYVNLFKKTKSDAVILKDEIDMPFIQQLEAKNEGLKFVRIDAEMGDALLSKSSKKSEEEMKKDTEVFEGLFKKVLKKDGIKVQVAKLRNKEVSSMLTLSEESRRMADMMKQYGVENMDLGAKDETLILNKNHKLVDYVLKNPESSNVDIICQELYDLARIQQKTLDPEAMTRFIDRTNRILSMITEENLA